MCSTNTINYTVYTVFDIVKTENKLFSKIATVYTLLDDEVNKIKDDVENNY